VGVTDVAADIEARPVHASGRRSEHGCLVGRAEIGGVRHRSKRDARHDRCTGQAPLNQLFQFFIPRNEEGMTEVIPPSPPSSGLEPGDVEVHRR
jgi:hypothetical protein